MDYFCVMLRHGEAIEQFAGGLPAWRIFPRIGQRREYKCRDEYGAFGELIRSSGLLATNNPFRFSTKYQDDESDLLFYGYRYYNGSTGRWLNRDPIGELGGLNLYAYVGNNPVNFH